MKDNQIQSDFHTTAFPSNWPWDLDVSNIDSAHEVSQFLEFYQTGILQYILQTREPIHGKKCVHKRLETPTWDYYESTSISFESYIINDYVHCLKL